MPTLLQSALQSSAGKGVRHRTEDEQDLAVAWMTRQVSTGQVCDALGYNERGKSNAKVYVWLAVTLRAAANSGRCRAI